MKRVIVTPAVLAPSALAELKDWLGLSLTSDDAQLTALLRAGLDLCESFTGTMPLQQGCEEMLWVRHDWQRIAAHPVQAITALWGLPADATRFALPSANYLLDLDPEGGGRVKVLNPGAAGRIVVSFTAGIAPDWDSLPEPLRQGVLRFAAHQYREREDLGAKSAVPPAAVAALWRPWRRLRLA